MVAATLSQVAADSRRTDPRAAGGEACPIALPDSSSLPVNTRTRQGHVHRCKFTADNANHGEHYNTCSQRFIDINLHKIIVVFSRVLLLYFYLVRIEIIILIHV